MNWGVVQTEITTLDGEVATLNNKTLYQSTGTSGTSPYTRFQSDIRLNNGLVDNVILSSNGGSMFYNDVTMTDNLAVNGSIVTSQISSSSYAQPINIGSSTQLGSVIINGYVSMPLMGFSLTGGFFNQFT